MSTCPIPRHPDIFERSRTCVKWSAFANPVFDMEIETISIMSKLFRPYLIAILVLIWAFDIWQQGLLLRANGSARHWRWYGAVTGMTFSLAYKNHWSLALAFTAFAITWSRLPDSPSKDAASLPSFNKFIKSLSDASPPEPSPTEANENNESYDPNEANEPDDGPDCIVCWSSSTPPKILPCTHLICADCLTNIRASTQNHCPMCRLPLFTRSNLNTIRTYRAIACIWNADITVRLLAISLHIHKSDSFTGTFTRSFIFDVVWVFWEGFYTLWMQKMIREGGRTGEWWRNPAFSRLDGTTFWRRPVMGLVMMGFTLLFKMHEVGELDEKMVISRVR